MSISFYKNMLGINKMARKSIRKMLISDKYRNTYFLIQIQTAVTFEISAHNLVAMDTGDDRRTSLLACYETSLSGRFMELNKHKMDIWAVLIMGLFFIHCLYGWVDFCQKPENVLT